MGHLPRGEKYHLLINSQELFIVFENDAGPANKWRIRGDLKIQVWLMVHHSVSHGFAGLRGNPVQEKFPILYLAEYHLC